MSQVLLFFLLVPLEYTFAGFDLVGSQSGGCLKVGLEWRKLPIFTHLTQYWMPLAHREAIVDDSFLCSISDNSQTWASIFALLFLVNQYRLLQCLWLTDICAITNIGLIGDVCLLSILGHSIHIDLDHSIFRWYKGRYDRIRLILCQKHLACDWIFLIWRCFERVSKTTRLKNEASHDALCLALLRDRPSVFGVEALV